MKNLHQYINSSIGKKQIIASTGLLLIGYVVFHLAGNLLIFAGPETFNVYAKKFADLRPWLSIVEGGLAAIFIIHMLVTALLIIENINARGKNYKIIKPPTRRSLATRLMPYTGTLILVFVIIHIRDFTLIDHHGPLSIMSDGKSYGLYGVVYNTFRDPTHSCFYIVAMMAVGLHLSHGMQSFMQTFGFVTDKNRKCIQWTSGVIALLVAYGFSSIPVYVLLQ